MGKFAFLLYFLDVQDVVRKYPIAKYLPERLVENIFCLIPPQKLSHIPEVKSPHGEAEGWLILCPLTAHQMLKLSESFLYKRVTQAGKLARKLGAQILGVGAFSPVVRDAGTTIAQDLGIAGTSYAVAAAIEGTREAARLMGHDLRRAHVVIVGATDSVGKVCTLLLARKARQMTLVARDEAKLEEFAARILYETGLAVRVTSNVAAALRTAQVVVIAATSAADPVFEPKDLMSGAVVCNILSFRNISKKVVEQRKDVLVIEDGLVEVPGESRFSFGSGLSLRIAYTSLVETMILALEERYENFSLGKELTIQQVEEINNLAKKHGLDWPALKILDRLLP